MTPTWLSYFARKGLALDGSQVRLLRLLIRILESEGELRGVPSTTSKSCCITNRTIGRSIATWPISTLKWAEPERDCPALQRGPRPRAQCQWQVEVDIAGIFSRIDHQKEAERIYRTQILAADPTVEDAWLGLAELKLAQGHRHEAIAIYREAAGHLPDSSVPYHLARLMVTEHDLEEILAEEGAEVLYHLGVRLCPRPASTTKRRWSLSASSRCSPKRSSSGPT